ncbi:MAG: Mannitol repressor [Phenylobacterium sp.]|nr:Mannitol repressor [Phenylobacterium sp.]
MAILVGACVEDSLRDHIRGRLRPDLKASEVSALLDGDAPLATFSAKIRFGYAASLYGPLTRDDLDLIRLIRNTCAHSQRRVSFDLAVFSRPIERLHRIKGHVETVLVGGNTPRNRFIRAAMMIDMALMGLTNGKYKEEDRGFLLP